MTSNDFILDEGWMIGANQLKNHNDGYVPLVNPEDMKFFVVEQSFEQIFNVRDNFDDKQSFQFSFILKIERIRNRSIFFILQF